MTARGITPGAREFARATDVAAAVSRRADRHDRVALVAPTEKDE